MPAPLVAGALALAAEFAPSLIRLFAGDKAGDVAEKVATVAKAVTGEDDPDKAAVVLRQNPELALTFKTRAAEIELEHEKALLADRADARARDVAIRQAGSHNRRADVLAFLACAGLIFCVWLIARESALPERAVNAIMFVAGVFAAAVRDVFAFEFGSSRGSREKDALLADKR